MSVGLALHGTSLGRARFNDGVSGQKLGRFSRGKNPPATGSKLGSRERANPHPLQSLHPVADGLEHETNLAFNPLRQREGHHSGFDLLDGDRFGKSAFDHHAFEELVSVFLSAEDAIHGNQIFFFHAEPRVGQFLG
jgi:hypothetical protein